MPLQRFPIRARIAFTAAALLWPGAVAAADAERGRALYELRCDSCHSTSVHGRKSRAAADFEAIRKWVDLWSEHLGLAWSAEEIDDVAHYLNEAYYRHPCPARVCKLVS